MMRTGFQSLIGRFGTSIKNDNDAVVIVSIPYRKVRYSFNIWGATIMFGFQSLIGRFGTLSSGNESQNKSFNPL